MAQAMDVKFNACTYTNVCSACVATAEARADKVIADTVWHRELLTREHLVHEELPHAAAHLGHAACLRAACREHECVPTRVTCSLAIQTWSPPCLLYLFECVPDIKFPFNVLEAAASRGDADTLRSALPFAPLSFFAVDVCRVLEVAAQNGHVACMRALRDYKDTRWFYVRTSRACEVAAGEGHLNCLAFAHTQGVAWSASTLRAAAGGGHLACLQYAHEHGCPWTADVTAVALRGGQLACLQYAHEHGCPWDGGAIRDAYGDWIMGEVTRRHPIVRCMLYARTHGALLTAGTFRTEDTREQARNLRLQWLNWHAHDNPAHPAYARINALVDALAAVPVRPRRPDGSCSAPACVWLHRRLLVRAHALAQQRRRGGRDAVRTAPVAVAPLMDATTVMVTTPTLTVRRPA